MRVGNFSLLIPEGRERDGGHVEMAHGTVYSLKMMNHWNNRRCDVKVVIDGKFMGTFRIPKQGQIVLERSADDDGCFTFFRADSDEGKATGLNTLPPSQQGLVQVTFLPEKEETFHTAAVKGFWGGGSSQEKTGGIRDDLLSMAPCSEGMSFAPGGTALTGASQQRFTDVPPLDYDSNESVLISLRLVCGKNVRPLNAVAHKGNPIPSPV